jgi:hypothetical protein
LFHKDERFKDEKELRALVTPPGPGLAEVLRWGVKCDHLSMVSAYRKCLKGGL